MLCERYRTAVSTVACVLVAASVLAACDGSSDDGQTTVTDASSAPDGSALSPDDGSPGSASSSPSSAAPNATPPAPVADDAVSTLDFLDGDGAPLLAMHQTALDWDAGASADDCNAIGDTLDREVSTDQAGLLIAGVDDEPLQTLLDAERIALHVSLTACLDQTTVPATDDGAPLDEIVPLVQQRLDDLEAAAR